jgi:hypothetical protein
MKFDKLLALKFTEHSIVINPFAPWKVGKITQLKEETVGNAQMASISTVIRFVHR